MFSDRFAFYRINDLFITLCCWKKITPVFFWHCEKWSLCKSTTKGYSRFHISRKTYLFNLKFGIRLWLRLNYFWCKNEAHSISRKIVRFFIPQNYAIKIANFLSQNYGKIKYSVRSNISKKNSEIEFDYRKSKPFLSQLLIILTYTLNNSSHNHRDNRIVFDIRPTDTFYGPEKNVQIFLSQLFFKA